MTPERWQQIKSLVNSALEQSAEQRLAVLQQSCAEDLSLRQGAEALLSFHEQATRNLAAPARLSSAGTMPAERWQQIEQIFQSAIEMEPAQRAAYLANTCGGDEELRHEVEALLVFQTGMSGVIQGAVHQAAGLLANTTEKARFTPGMTLNKRYRIIGQLGKGGMGEVYRADDLKLGHPVALKFLTERLSEDKAMLARFHSEVAMAHRVTHPNVCRVHDIGEVTTSSGNLHFLSMEYVDGEDLSSLLRRIGRLPADKAVEIANQLCAGLAAAHEAGVLHRDLKPANIMLDGKGRVRITDFGLAGFAEQIRGEEVFAGTPAYMSPEQFAGKEVSTKSDIYALGLVLYEIFTGKRVFEAASLDELRRLHESSSPTNPSNWVKDIDPLVERVILRCLEKDPSKRFASAKQVADALPGGDPLAAALALGETPSPEMVAAAGEKTGLRPTYAVACLLAIVIGLIAIAFVNRRMNLIERITFDNPPEILVRKGREIISQLGYPDQPVGKAYGMNYGPSFFYIEQNDLSPERWRHLASGRPAPIAFWYRESPRYIEALIWGRVAIDEPLLYQSGMKNLVLDAQGRLVYFETLPPQLDQTKIEFSTTDWKIPFSLAGLDIKAFTLTDSQWLPLGTCDTRAAWTGVFPERPDIPLRIEAAGWRGHVIYFQLIGPWVQPRRMPANQPVTADKVRLTLLLSLTCVLLIGAGLIARYNFRHGRGDRQGAARLAAFVFVAWMVKWALVASHIPSQLELFLLIRAISEALFMAGIAWLTYFAIEPYVRKRWPSVLISWSQVLGGNLRSPLVGRHMLFGVLWGIWYQLAVFAVHAINIKNGQKPETDIDFDTLLGLRFAGGTIASLMVTSIGWALMYFLLIFLVRLIIQRNWLIGIVFTLVGALTSNFLGYSSPILYACLTVVTGALTFVFMIRFGFFSTVMSFFIADMLLFFPITTNLSAWYSWSAWLAILMVLVMAGYAFHTSLGGQKVFAGKLLEE